MFVTITRPVLIVHYHTSLEIFKFYLMSIFQSGLPSRLAHYLQQAMSCQVPLGYGGFSDLFLKILTVLSTGQIFCRMPLWNFISQFSQDLTEVMNFGRGNTPQGNCHFHHIVAKMHSPGICSLMLTLVTWPRWCFSIVKSLFLLAELCS